MAGGEGQEFNAVVATEDGGLHTVRLLLVNAAVLAFTAGMLVWAGARRDRIDPRFIDRPSLALFNYFYFNPFSKKIIPKSVFHYIAFAPTILLMKAFAVLNNSLIATGTPDLVTPFARAIHGLGAGPMMYWIVIIVMFHPLWYLGLLATARALRGPLLVRAPNAVAI